MEKIQNIIENTVGNSKHFETVQEELLDFEFQYIDKLEKKEIEAPEEDVDFDETNNYYKFRNKFKEGLTSPFSEYLFEYTTLFNKLVDSYYKRIDKKDFKEDICDDWVQNIFNEIGVIHDTKNAKWRDDIFSLIKRRLDEIGPEIEGQKQDEKKKNFGLIHSNITKDKRLTKFGLNAEDFCLDIHLSDLYKQKKENKSIVNIFSEDSLSKVACDIVDNHSDIKAVIGRSWLIDSPLGKRIGFIKYDENRNLRNDGFWGQFINEKGEIKKDKINKFLETGQPEYFVSAGFIKVEDFLRYLPEEKKSSVKLKDRTEESLNFGREIEKIKNEIENKFDKLSYEEIEKLIMKSVLVDFFKTNEGIEFLGYVKKAKAEKIKTFSDIKDERFSELQKEFIKFVEEKENQYIEREVTIK